MNKVSFYISIGILVCINVWSLKQKNMFCSLAKEKGKRCYKATETGISQLMKDVHF